MPNLHFETEKSRPDFYAAFAKWADKRNLRDFLTLGFNYEWIAEEYESEFVDTMTRAQQEQWVDAHRRIPGEMIAYYGSEEAVPKFEPFKLGMGTFLLGSNTAFPYANFFLPFKLDINKIIDKNCTYSDGYFCERIPYYQFPWEKRHRYFYSRHVTDFLIDTIIESKAEIFNGQGD